MMDCIGADGVFTGEFAGAAMTHLGDGYVEASGKERCKAIDDVHDLGGLVKVAADGRSKITKLEAQLGQAMVAPAEGATDAEKLAYRQKLDTARGATGNLDDYTFAVPDNLPEGLPFDEESGKGLAAFCCDNNIPVDVWELLKKVVTENAIQSFTTARTQEEEGFTTAVKAITDANQPDAITKMGRLAFKYVDKFCSEEVKESVVRPLTGEKDVAGKIINGPDGQPKRGVSMYEIPHDFEEWRKRGFGPEHVQHMAKVAEVTVAGESKTGGPGSAEVSAADKFQDACSAKSPAMQTVKA